jgi:hypothetical protein
MPGSNGKLPIRLFMARDNSRIARWPFLNEDKLHKDNPHCHVPQRHICSDDWRAE